jgi:23S rRNA (guanosine2251-2'-O)-methyltransferase
MYLIELLENGILWSYMEKSSDRLVIGKHAVTELLRRAPKRVEKILQAGKGLPEEISKVIATNRLRLEQLSFDELSELAGSDSHQGLAAVLKERRYYSLAEFRDKLADQEKALIVMLDGVFDPHNVGAIMRAAECFDVAGIIWSKNRGASLTPTVTKSAAGASELLPLVQVSNLADTIRKLREDGFWSAATALTDRAENLSNFEPPAKLILILGSEGKGVSNLLIKEADFILQAPMLGSIDSLNVSQAAAVFLYELQRERLKGEKTK